MTPSTLPEETAPGRTALRVGDLPPVREFYESVVGLRTLSRSDAAATLGADEPLLELREDPDAPERHPRATGLYHNAFRVPSRAALGDALARVRDRWALDGAADHGVSEALYLDDPEGNGVEIYRDRPREEWPIAADGSVEMDSRPLDLAAVAAASDDRSADGDAGGADDAADPAERWDEVDDAVPRSRAPPGTTLGHVHLEVSDLGPAREFYVDALGLGVRQEYSGSALFLAADDYHHHVGLNTWNGRSRPPEGRGLLWFDLVLPDADALSAARRRLESAGVPIADVEDGFEVADPDGIAIRLRAGA